ncbi:hypothetical protein Tco_0421857 [Tanacetum coccineum]
MAWLPNCEELERVVGGRNWLDMMIVYFDEYVYEHQEFTHRLNGLIGEINEAWQIGWILFKNFGVWRINALCDTLTTVIDERWAFIGELEMLAYTFVPGKMAEFMKEIQDKDIPNLMKLQILGNCWSKRALFADVHRCLSDSSLFFAASVTVLWLVAADAEEGVPDMSLMWNIVDQRKIANTSTPLLQELARAADSDDIRDRLLVLLTREVADDTEKMENYRQLSGQLRNGVRMRDIYIRELWTSDMSDEVVKSIEILKRMQLDDMEKTSRLLLMAREIQSKVFEKNIFIARLRD